MVTYHDLVVRLATVRFRQSPYLMSFVRVDLYSINSAPHDVKNCIDELINGPPCLNFDVLTLFSAPEVLLDFP